MKNIHYVQNSEQLDHALEYLETKKIVAFDTETNGLSPIKNDVLLIQVGDEYKQFVFDVYLLGDSIVRLVNYLAKPTVKKVAHNAKFDYSMMLSNFGVSLPNIACTYVGAALLTKGILNISNGLDACLAKYLNVKIEKKQQKSFVGMKLGEEFTSEQIEYAGEDVEHLINLLDAISDLINDRGMRELYVLENETVRVCGDLEVNGIYLDSAMWLELAQIAKIKANEAKLKLDQHFKPICQWDIFGEPVVNYNSPAQLKPLLEQLTGQVVEGTGEKELKKIKHPVIKDLLAFRGARKQVTTYGDEFVREHINPITGRIHSDFRQLGTDSGRMASRNPNCFSEDTETLTLSGWKYFKDLEVTDKVAQYHDDGSIDFVLPTKIHSYKFEGTHLINIDSEGVKMLTTPDHRILTMSRTGKVLYDDLAIDFYTKFKDTRILDRKFIRAGRFKGELEPLSEEDKMSLELAVIVQNEGWLKPNGEIEVSFEGMRKKSQISNLFGERVSPRGLNSNRLFLNVKPSEVSRWLEPDTKTFKHDEILNLSSQDRSFFLDVIHKWDGDFTRNATFGQTTKRRNAVDLVQALYVLSGRSTKWYYNEDKDFCVINNHHKAERFCSRVDITKVPYEGKVYCVSVPSQKILIRYKNQASVAWNCQNIPKGAEYRACFRAQSPDYKIISADFSG